MATSSSFGWHDSAILPADGGKPVARAGALHRPREQSAEGQNFPEAMLRICPGYHPADGGNPVAQWRILPTDGGEPVARAGALRRPREQSAEGQNFPEAMLRICPGYHPADGGKPVAQWRILSTDGCKPVARAGALRRPREQSAEEGGRKKTFSYSFILRYVTRRF